MQSWEKCWLTTNPDRSKDQKIGIYESKINKMRSYSLLYVRINAKRKYSNFPYYTIHLITKQKIYVILKKNQTKKPQQENIF